MTPNERVEAVARKLARLTDYFGGDDLWQMHTDDAKEIIGLVLQSLLEPSEGMAIRAVYTGDFDRVTTAERIWCLMIQQAIKEME